MDPLTAGEQVTIDVHLPDGGVLAHLAGDARTGLTAVLKELPPKYFYDERGSRLFERITELPEYYPARAERAILERYAGEIVTAAEPRTLIELGSGSAAKTRRLLDAMRDAGCLERYVAVDIAEEITRETAARLVGEYPGLRVHGVICDFEHHLELLPGDGRRLIAFLGGTIGNLPPAARRTFLARIAALLGPEDAGLLLGTDLVKDHKRLEAAYNDSAGVTAEFNKNVLRVLNRELGADFDPDAFAHRAFYEPGAERIEMRLRSVRDQTVRIPALDLEVPFASGEELRTEISTKFTRAGLERDYAAAGLELAGWWTDPDDLFALSLARPGQHTPNSRQP